MVIFFESRPGKFMRLDAFVLRNTAAIRLAIVRCYIRLRVTRWSTRDQPFRTFSSELTSDSVESLRRDSRSLLRQRVSEPIEW